MVNYRKVAQETLIDIEYLQGGGLHNISGQPEQWTTTLTDFFVVVSVEFPVFQLRPIASCLFIGYH